MKVLFIDDELRYNIPNIIALRENGIEVLFVQNIPEAFSILKSNIDSIGCILLDVMLTDIGLDEKLRKNTQRGYSTGIVLIDEFRKIMMEFGREIPIFIYSARDDLPNLDSKKVKIVSKSTQISELIKILKNVKTI